MERQIAKAKTGKDKQATYARYLSQYKKFMEIGSGKFKMANQGFIRQLPLICPPLVLQEQIAAFVEQTDKSKLCGEMEVAA